MTWMTNGKLLSVKWKAFMELLGYEDKGLDNQLAFDPTRRPPLLTSPLFGPIAW